MHCNMCGYTFVPGLKNPNTCGPCFRRYVTPQRKKAGLSDTPNIDKTVVEKRNREKIKYKQWMIEEMQSDNFGRKVKVKKKLNPVEEIMKEAMNS